MSKYRFPIRSGNSFELLIDGAAFFPRMLSAIERARRWVLLEIYLFESGRNANRFIEALGAAAARGVQVNVLIDGWGARGLTGADRERLEGRGVHVAFHNELHYRKWLRNLLRDHRKILLVDDRFGYVGGAGITDEFDAATSAQSWHDIMVEIRGPVLADWRSLFVEEWNRFASRPLAAGAADAAERAAAAADDMPG